MEEKFNTSFIPKKSLEADVDDTSKEKYAGGSTPHGPGFFLSLLILILSVVSCIGLFGYLKVVEKSADEKIAKLEDQKNKFNEEEIDVLLRADARIQNVKGILNKHVAFSALLSHLEKITLKSVQYTSLIYTGGIDETPIVSISGKTGSYQDVALQTTEYRKSPSIFTPTVKALERNKETEAVEFEVGAILDPSLMLFSSALAQSASSNPSSDTDVIPAPEEDTTGTTSVSVGSASETSD